MKLKIEDLLGEEEQEKDEGMKFDLKTIDSILKTLVKLQELRLKSMGLGFADVNSGLAQGAQLPPPPQPPAQGVNAASNLNPEQAYNLIIRLLENVVQLGGGDLKLSDALALLKSQKEQVIAELGKILQ